MSKKLILIFSVFPLLLSCTHRCKTDATYIHIQYADYLMETFCAIKPSRFIKMSPEHEKYIFDKCSICDILNLIKQIKLSEDTVLSNIDTRMSITIHYENFEETFYFGGNIMQVDSVKFHCQPDELLELFNIVDKQQKLELEEYYFD